MSYTGHTWTTGETITADKMNNIEEGIAEASQSGGNPIITFNFWGFGSISTYWCFAIGELDGDTYIAKRLVNSDNDVLLTTVIYNPNGEYVYSLPLSVPKTEGWALLFQKPSTEYYDTTVSGDISQSTVSFNYGSVGDAYIITGDCTINITAI